LPDQASSSKRRSIDEIKYIVPHARMNVTEQIHTFASIYRQEGIMKTAISRIFLLSASALISAPLALAQSANPVKQGSKNVPEFVPAFAQQTRAPETKSGIKFDIATVTDGLVHPWGIAVLPDGGFLVTERIGRLRHISADSKKSDPIAGIPEVFSRKQGGLLDVELAPDFSQSRMIYWTYSKPMGGGKSATAAARGKLSDDNSKVTEVEDIFVQKPPSPSPMHYGSRIVFNKQGLAFVTTGEHFTGKERVLAQDLGTTYGKVIRINLDGSVPDDNPFVGKQGSIDTIWSYGHRNIQGADIHPETDELWTIEHGPKGGDELNTPKAGKNYGWPVISYGENYNGSPVGQGITQLEGMEQPRYYWDPVIAPAGMTFYEGDMFADWKGNLLISSLKPGAIVRLEFDGDTVTGEEWLLTDQGRIRDIAEAQDGSLLVLTDKRNGAVLKLTPAAASK
jgi:glucose/arabinose dehydrogenase